MEKCRIHNRKFITTTRKTHLETREDNSYGIYSNWTEKQAGIHVNL